jgi:hypothetical protein
MNREEVRVKYNLIGPVKEIVKYLMKGMIYNGNVKLYTISRKSYQNGRRATRCICCKCLYKLIWFLFVFSISFSFLRISTRNSNP